MTSVPGLRAFTAALFGRPAAPDLTEPDQTPNNLREYVARLFDTTPTD